MDLDYQVATVTSSCFYGLRFIALYQSTIIFRTSHDLREKLMATSNKNSFALVTGASTGIGYHLARVFAENGFDLFVTAEEARLAEAVSELKRSVFKCSACKRIWPRTVVLRSFGGQFAGLAVH
jgi:hypothetical protein